RTRMNIQWKLKYLVEMLLFMLVYRSK
ncbi:unnamed protein product, partial [Rotaria socialis]